MSDGEVESHSDRASADPAIAKSPFKWPVIIKVIGLVGIIGICVVGVVAIYEWKHSPFVKVSIGGEATIATTPVTVRLGATTLVIPRNYFSIYPRYGGRPGVPDAVEFGIWGLFPDLEPISEVNRNEFRSKGLGRIINTLIWSNMSPRQLRSQAEQDQMVFNSTYDFAITHDGTVGPGDYGSDKFGYIHVHSWNDVYFRGSVGRPSDTIICMTLLNGPFPDCRRRLVIGRNITADVTFSRGLLGKTKEIESKIVDTLNRFRISGPTLEIVQ